VLVFVQLFVVAVLSLGFYAWGLGADAAAADATANFYVVGLAPVTVTLLSNAVYVGVMKVFRGVDPMDLYQDWQSIYSIVVAVVATLAVVIASDHSLYAGRGWYFVASIAIGVMQTAIVICNQFERSDLKRITEAHRSERNANRGVKKECDDLKKQNKLLSQRVTELEKLLED